MQTSGEQLLIGLGTAGLCLWGLVRARWFYAQTRKGRRLARWFGEERGLFVLRLLFVLGIAFGIALALNWIRPLFA